jgi:hypothetical protein
VTLHLIKLCVGAESLEDLMEWRRRHFAAGDPWLMHTRQTPRRAAELVDGGSLYWVIKGMIQCRQSIQAIATVGEGSAARCEVTLDLEPIVTAAAPRRPFQGWRYLRGEDAPPDLPTGVAEGAVPYELETRLRQIGAW